MPAINSEQRIIELSFNELTYILHWVNAREDSARSPVTVLIGGWAVYSYNDYYGSVDIDLVTNNATKSSLEWHLLNMRGYEHYRAYGSHGVGKHTEYGWIIIDYISRETQDPFEGRTERLDFHLLDTQTELRRIRDGGSVAVPTRALLLLFKLKAAWDRAYRIEHGQSGDALTRERGKLIKDYADLLALIDPNFGGTDLDLGFLGEQFARFGFLKNCLRIIPGNNDALAKYGNMDQATARETCDTLLSLIAAI
jgi:hypothetical protein